MENKLLEGEKLKKEEMEREGLKGFVLGNLRNKQLDFAVQPAFALLNYKRN